MRICLQSLRSNAGVELSQSAGWVGVQYWFVWFPEGVATMSNEATPPDSAGTDDSCTDTVEMTTTDQVAQYLIEDQMADLPDAIREAVQNGVDSPGASRVLVEDPTVRAAYTGLVTAIADRGFETVFQERGVSLE